MQGRRVSYPRGTTLFQHTVCMSFMSISNLTIYPDYNVVNVIIYSINFNDAAQERVIYTLFATVRTNHRFSCAFQCIFVPSLLYFLSIIVLYSTSAKVKCQYEFLRNSIVFAPHFYCFLFLSF